MAKFVSKKAEDVVIKSPMVVKDERIQDKLMDDERKPRVSGNWRKVTATELADFEARGLLKGFDPATSEALLKE